MFLLLLGVPAVTTGATKGNSQPFALVSPRVAARLKSQVETSQAKAVIREADKGLARKPGALPRIHTEGTLPHQGIRDESLKAAKDFETMRDLGLAYRLTGERRYLNGEARYLSAWLSTYQISFNPIDETRFDAVIIGYDLTRASLPVKLQQKMDGFLRAMAEGYLDRIAKQRVEDNANWQSHRVKLITLAAFETGDEGLIGRARKAFQRQVEVNIRPDGSVVDFYKRDALHYVTYDLEPLVTASLAAKAHGEDWFHYQPREGASVAQAVNWLTPYATGAKTHDEFVRSLVRFDAERAAAGEKGFSGRWDPATSVTVYAMVTAVDKGYAQVYKSMSRTSKAKAPAWIILLTKAGM